MPPDTHFVFGTHPKYGVVASATTSIPAHLAHWSLTREQFDPIADEPGLYQLTEPERDGPRRTRQAAQDLLRHGYAVHIDTDLAHAPATPSPPLRPDSPTERRSRITQASTSQSPQRRTPPTTSPPSAHPIPQKPLYAPTVHLPASGPERSR